MSCVRIYIKRVFANTIQPISSSLAEPHGQSRTVLAQPLRHRPPSYHPRLRERSSAGWDVARTLATMAKPVKLCVKLLEEGGSHTIRFGKDLRGGEQIRCCRPPCSDPGCSTSSTTTTAVMRAASSTNFDLSSC